MDQGEITPDSCHPHFDYSSSSSGGGNVTGSCDVNCLFEIQKHEALLKLQQMVNRYNECFNMLKDTLTAVEVLRLENLRLKSENLELEIAVQEIEKLALKNVADSFDSPTNIESGSGSEVISGSGGSGTGSGKSSGVISSSDGSGSGTGSEVITISNPSGSNGPVKAPKSISIRSRGYLEGNEKTSGGGSRRLRLPAPNAIQGDEKETIGEVEVEVYNQGTTKTELCNKWEREGLCPYKDRCQFAHGVEELRPVIRHPRYKTQLCRMMDASGGCPYGHRCHFRHALAPRPHDN